VSHSSPLPCPGLLQSKLTALLRSLRGIRYEKPQRRKVIKNLCVAAYPDVQPWQIKQACLDPSLSIASKKSCGDKELRELYYSYLSELLDPVEGQEAARHNSKLVKVNYARTDRLQWPRMVQLVSLPPFCVSRNGATGPLA